MLWLENIAPVFPKVYSDLEKDYKKIFFLFGGAGDITEERDKLRKISTSLRSIVIMNY